MAKPYITNIQRYSIHDGNGIRTTVFFKGCPLKCAWCHNPETQRFAPEILYNAEKCSLCARCQSACPKGGIDIQAARFTAPQLCIACGACADKCLSGARELSGKYYSPAELVRILLRDLPFYEQSGGGVTLSGGEVMVQDMDYLLDVLRRLKEHGISVNIDTCGLAPADAFTAVLPYIDTFLFDLKLATSAQHLEYTGAGNEQILSNLRLISSLGANIRIRVPLIRPINTSPGDIDGMIALLGGIKGIRQVDLLAYHDTGMSKYTRLGMEYAQGMSTPDTQELERIADQFRAAGFNTFIGG